MIDFSITEGPQINNKASDEGAGKYFLMIVSLTKPDS
jgi:hypothetical protein